MKSILLSVLLIAVTHAQLDMTSDKKMEYEDNIAEESQSSEQRIFTDVIAPKPILNDGKPFYVARDPTTGTLDFSSKKTVGIQNDIPISRKDELTSSVGSKGHDINSIGHTFHDYLNIPVKYSSSKFVYPLISSSYANLKYQGNNKNQISNHKNYTSTLGTTTNSPKYFTHIITLKSATEYTTQPPVTTRRIFTTQSTTEKTTEKSSTTTSTTTTERPTTTSSTTTISTTPQRPTVPSTEASSTVKYSSTIIQSSQFPSTFKKYVDSSETRKKFTTEKPNDTTLPANPVKFLDDILDAIDRKETTIPPPTTHRPNNILSFVTSMPLRPSGFKPMPTEAPRNYSQKITFEKAPSDAMTLSEIFNSIAGNDENYSNEGNNVIYETADSSHVEIKKPLPLSTLTTSTQTPTLPPPTQNTLVQHKTLQQQMKNPQYIDLPVHQPPQLIAGKPQGGFNAKQPQQQSSQFDNSHVGFPTDSFDDYVEFENPDDQYVRYEVQKPNVNMVKFQQMPLPSINNVVISPGQNSASFVLGSKQSVGSIGVGSSMGVGTSHFVDHNSNGPVKMGQVINEEPPMRPNTNNNQIQGSIRFPNDAENAFDNAPIIKGTFKLDGNVDSIHPPQALLQNQPAASQISLVTQNPVVFSSNNPHVMQAELSVGMSAPSGQPTNPSQVIFENVNDIYEKVNDKKQKQDIKEVSSNNLSPPSVLTPPNPVQLNQFNRPPQYGPQRRPQKPNILPQFRPNSRLSQGHPLYRQEVGAIRVPPNLQFKPFPPQAVPKVGLPPMNPNMRRIPPQAPQNYRPQYVESSNRRVFKVPPPATQQFPIADRFMKPPPMQQPPLYYLNRPVTSANPETMQMQQRPSIVPYQDVELNKSYPPTPSINITSINDNEEGNGKLEPVVTLQMLQAKKNGNKLNIPNNIPSVSIPHEIPQELSYLPKNHKNDIEPLKEPSVYVVYPVSGDNSLSNDEKKEEQVSIPSANEYQNTPFTVVSHFEQEPLLIKKDKKKQQFPYQIEKPVPPHVEKIPLNFNSPHVHSIYNIGEEPHDPISSKLTRITEKPIAIAYTPTEPSRISPPMSYYQHYQPQHLYSSPNFASPVISEIIDENHHGFDYDYYHRQHQVHSTYNSGEEVNEFHKQHYDFEAPFHASVSLNPEVTNPYQGWSIVTTKATDTNKIDRSDLHVLDSGEEVSTKKYDPEEFQPVFETGFQPIYSSNRVSTAPELNSNEDSHELPSTLALSQTSTVSIVEKSASTTTEMPKVASNEVKTSTESTTVKAVEQKKPQSMEIDSLEALFESLTRDYDDEEDSSASNKSENESRSL